jgi:hypothetical protein
MDEEKLDGGFQPLHDVYLMRPRTNPFAIASLVLAFFATVLSIIFGHVALSQIKRTGERGRGLALAGLWISYLSVVALVATIGVVWVMAVNAQHAATTALQAYGRGGATYAAAPYSYGSTPGPTYSAPAVGSQSQENPSPSTATGPAGVGRPASSFPTSNADRAYCQNRGVLLWLARSATYRGALCSINGATTMISMASDVGGNVALPATASTTSFSATGQDGTVYTYAQGTVSIVTSSKTFTEPTTAWQPGTSSTLSSPGDLGISTPISYPSCDDSPIVVYGTAWNDATNASEVQKLLAAHPGSSYMRTDLSCRDFRGPSNDNSGGAYIYAVYTAPSSASSACQEIAGTSYYGRILSNTREPGDNALKCS